MPFFFLAVSYAQNKKSTVDAKLASITIEGNIKDVKDSTKVYLYRKNGSLGKKVGEGTIINGNFKMMVSPETELDKYNISVANFRGTLSFYSNPGQTTKVTGVGNRPANWMAENDTPIQKEINEYKNFDKENFPNLLRDENQLRILQDSLYKSQDVSGSDYYQNVGLDSLKNIVEKQKLERAVAMLDFLNKKSYSQIWLDAFYEISQYALKYSPTIYTSSEKHFKDYQSMIDEKKKNMYLFSDSQLKKAQSLYEKTPKEELETEKVLDIKSMLFPNELKVGEKFIEHRLFDYDGNVRHISDLFSKNKYVIIEFCSYGCGGYMMMLPVLKELYSKHSDKLDILTIEVSPVEAWDQHFYGKVEWNEWNDHKRGYEAMRKYNVVGVPTFFFLSSDGIVLGKCFAPEFEEMLSECIPDLQ